ncbi:MAG: glycosyltransferase family 2 protein [Bacteroidales bacterium]|nr:glycosyltransferase family 2 protein [Bacteroidales bacterium]
MKLSIILVNYNVKYFLEQCLYSVRKSIKDIEAEVFVVDNNSVDGSIRMLEEKFPEVILIRNKTNEGFSKANNQAIQQAKGEYILLLNPDTIVEDNTFSKIINFMDGNPKAGGLGVKMLDGKGKFLPESKRGLPTPAVAFYKIFGLAKLFPKSKLYGKYHLTYLDKNTIHKVDVLSGAFMLLRKTVLDEIGLLDESFFMYGEDIDMSYRITKAGYDNYYFPETRIIHYKGESTKKSSINYVFIFYNAMIIFAKKHFSQKNARLFSFLIKMAIYLRAGLAIINRFISHIFIPLLDAVVIFAGILLIKDYWEHNIIYTDGGHYPYIFIAVALPIYILIWLLTIYFSGGYDRPVKKIKILQGIFIGTLIILVIYSLLSEEYRFSRALIILGAMWAMIALLLIRYLLQSIKIGKTQIGFDTSNRFLIIGEQKEAERVADLLKKTTLNPGFIGLINSKGNEENNNVFIGHIGQLKEIIPIYKIEEVIFCARDIPADLIIDKMSELNYSEVKFKIAPPESLSIIGSNSINAPGDLYVININSITRTKNRRNKRMLDILGSLSLLLVSPVSVFIVNNPIGYFFNVFRVLIGRYSWVGYATVDKDDIVKLPLIKKAILEPTYAFKNRKNEAEAISRLTLLYARNYKFTNDLNIIYKGFKSLGKKSIDLLPKNPK